MWSRAAGPPPNPQADALIAEKQKEALEKAAKQHADLMYANTQLLKSVRYASIAMGLSAATLLVLYWFGTRNKGAVAPAAAPQVVAPAPVVATV